MDSNATLTTVNMSTTATTATASTNVTTTVTTSIVSSSMTSVLNNTITAIINSTIAPNQSTPYTKCLQQFGTSTCRLAEFIRVLAYLFLAVSLIPQIVHLFNHGSRYIAGISYISIVVRVLALASLMIAHTFDYSSVFELIALVSTVIIFVQITIYADNLHRQQKLTLVTVSLVAWLVGGGMILLLRKQVTFLVIMGYALLAMHMLPQILLNSLLRTAKAISKFSILFLAMSDTLLFAYFYTVNAGSPYLIASYYAFSFFLYIYLQSIVYTDAHIHLISRSAHTVLTPGVDVFTGLDASGTRASGDDPQMFSIDDLDTPDATDVVYQPVTLDKSTPSPVDQSPMKRIVWYATLASIFGIETVLTIMLVYRAWKPWIIFVPLSIPVVLGLFLLLRKKLSIIQTESLRKLL